MKFKGDKWPSEKFGAVNSQSGEWKVCLNSCTVEGKVSM